MAGVSVGLDLINPVQWAQTAVKYARLAVWAPNPVTQIAVNIAILVAAMLSSAVGFLPGLFIAGLALLFIGIALIRLLWRVLMR